MAKLFLKVIWIIVVLTYVVDTRKGIWLIDVVGETNLRTINITFEDEVLSNFYFASQALLQCTRFFISRSIICQFFVISMSWLRKV
jgi:hypothetical protein